MLPRLGIELDKLWPWIDNIHWLALGVDHERRLTAQAARTTYHGMDLPAIEPTLAPL